MYLSGNMYISNPLSRLKYRVVTEVYQTSQTSFKLIHMQIVFSVDLNRTFMLGQVCVYRQ